MTARRPNILWLMTDQHRADCLGAMGHPMIQTPHLDALAGEGLLFRNAFCQSPVCMSSRGSVMTGRYPQAISVHGMGILPPQEITVAEALARQGYRTGAFGKLHLTPQLYTRDQLQSDAPVLDWRRYEPAKLVPIPDDPYKVDYGFQTHVGYDDALNGNFRRWLAEVEPDLLAANPQRFGDDAPPDLWVSPYPSHRHPSRFIADHCDAFLRESADSAEPWFAFCSFVAPHHPFEAPADQLARYPLADCPLPAAKGGVDPQFIPEPIRQGVGQIERYSEETQRRLVQHYMASISLVDDCIGRLMATLRETDQLADTLIVFLADHGEFLGNHGLLRKPSMHYDEVMRVPMILRLPGGAAGGRQVPELVELVDVLPTLLGLAELPQHAGMQGRDWSAEIRAGEPLGHADIYSDMYTMYPMTHGVRNGPYGAAITLRSAEWKLTIYPDADASYGQLFDLANDPDEAVNLYAEPQHLATRERLLFRLLQRHHQQVNPLPLRLTQY